MAGILWLASYPKSGNTWLRIFIANLFENPAKPFDINALGAFVYGEMSVDLYERVANKPLAELDDSQLHQLRPKVHKLLAGLSQDNVFVKTHNAIAMQDGISTVTPEMTAGAIYVVRNPLDVVLSYADHYGLGLDDAIEAMASPENRVVTSAEAVFQYLGDWSGHALSWLDAPGLKVHVARYEDMLSEPIETFGAITSYLGVPAPRGRLRRAIRFSSFKELKRQENRAGFSERSRNSEAFFRAGKTDQWRQVLSAIQVDKIVNAHGTVMEQFGYLP